MTTISEYRTCIGNPDDKFLKLDIPVGRTNGYAEAYKERDFGACWDDFRYVKCLWVSSMSKLEGLSTSSKLSVYLILKMKSSPNEKH